MLRALELEDGVDPSFAGELLAALNDFATAYETGADGDAILADLYARHAAGGPHEISAVGHAHLDTAWLWPLEETWRKAQRSFSTQVRLTDEYPEHVFCASQAQHYAWAKERDPRLWQAIRERVARGQWVPVGGSWIEPDCNLPSGESLARQLLFGQRFFERELGRRCGELWQPDVFGYTAQLPQLMRLAGMTRFLTQKLSWNRFTKPEHHTFTWQGLDGSEVLTHFPPTDTYNAEATVAELRRGVRDYLDHPRSRDSLLIFGHGDGGGGPTRAMLERLRRTRDLRGLPRTDAARAAGVLRSPGERRARPADGRRRAVLRVPPRHLHQRRPRSSAETVAARRRCTTPRRCRALAARLRGAPYPRAELADAWRVLLVNQFHDILPGSSIAEVNERARADLAAVEERADALAGGALAALGADGDAPVVVNTTPFARREVVRDPAGALVVVEAPAYGAGGRGWQSSAPCAASARPTAARFSRTSI